MAHGFRAYTCLWHMVLGVTPTYGTWFGVTSLGLHFVHVVVHHFQTRVRLSGSDVVSRQTVYHVHALVIYTETTREFLYMVRVFRNARI